MFWNTDIQLPNCMVSQPTKLKYTWIWLIKDHVPYLETESTEDICPKLYYIYVLLYDTWWQIHQYPEYIIYYIVS